MSKISAAARPRVALLVAVLALEGLRGFAVAAPAHLRECAGVTQAAFNQDGSRVIVRTEDGVIGLWDAASGAAVPGALNAPGHGFIVSGDGRRVLVSRKDEGARIFDAANGAAVSPDLEVRFRDPAHPEAVFSPDGTRVLILETTSASALAVESGQRLAKLPLGENAGDADPDVGPSATFTKDGARCFLMNPSGLVTQFDTATWKPVGAPMRHPAAESAYTFDFVVSDDARWLATSDSPGENGPKGHLQVWDLAKGKALGKPFVAVNGMSGTFIPSSDRILVMGGRGEATIRDLPSLKKSATIRPHDDVDGPAIAVSPDGKWLLSWGADRTPRLIVAATGGVQESQAYDVRIAQVLMLPDSSGCLMVFDNTAFLQQDHHDQYVMKVSFPDLKTTHSLRITEWLNPVVLSPDGRRFLIRSGDSNKEHVIVYETSDLKPTVR